ncbi:hypothetical protein HPB48_002617 [Haemaphysalis longicornis]|uniref:Reverse transcriptase domain-containing protein n=1 Tax=Haemaphysalis longicornis TaxID=44386 RepID=A0A9J6G192_HAELO|nr:hypothetical protein HPB48_002617 [Haemaphysalis longicornis]
MQSDLVVNKQVATSLSVTRGVRQGCPLSPLLFVLAIEPFLKNVENNSHILGLQLPGSQTVKVTAYADDVTLYLRDEDSLVHALNCFEEYSELAGATLNCTKSKALSLSPLEKQHIYGIPVVTHVEILGVTYTSSGVSLKTWHQTLKQLREDVNEALAYDFPYAVRRYLALNVFTGKVWYIAGTAALPRYIAVKITSEVLRLFWSDKTALVKTGKLGLPRQFGGWNIPSVTNYAVTYALKSVLRVLDLQTGHPARQLCVYFLGAQARLFPQHTPDGPKATQPPPFYAKVIAAYKKLTTHNSQREVEDMRNIELAQKLDETSPENLEEKQKNFPWRTLINANVPGEAQDVT